MYVLLCSSSGMVRKHRGRFNMDIIMNLDQRGVVKGERVPPVDVHATGAGSGAPCRPSCVNWILQPIWTWRW